jgi:hypothetical protein
LVDIHTRLIFNLLLSYLTRRPYDLNLGETQFCNKFQKIEEQIELTHIVFPSPQVGFIYEEMAIGDI